MIPPEGQHSAAIVIVGEAPGSLEEKIGQPFVGASGQLLNELMAACGINRRDCYLTNVIKERPPNNDLSPFIEITGKKVKRTPLYDAYEAALKDELSRCKANIIVAMGNVSLYALTGRTGITKWRGSLLESSLFPGRKVIPTLHPAAALRTYIWKHLILFDLQKVKRESSNPAPPIDTRKYFLRPTLAECFSYLEACNNAPLVAFDIEVSGTEVSCISFSYDASHAISIPFIAGGKHYFTPDQETALWRKIGEVLEATHNDKIGQNVTFDTTFLYDKYGIAPKNLHDTMVACAILLPDFSKGLDFITSIYTDIPYYKEEGKGIITGKVAHHDDAFWLYNAKDSIVLMEAWPRMQGDLVKQGNWDTYKRQTGLIEPLVFMASHGIKVDGEGLKDRSAQAKIEAIELQVKLDELTAPHVLNINSPLQVREYFYKVKKERPIMEQGVPTVNELALKKLAVRGLKEANVILLMRKVSKMDGTYYSVRLSADGRLRASMNPVGTRMGRISSSQNIFGEGTNLQNQPREMKRFMQTDEGHVAYTLDLSQAENRVVAYLGPDIKMIEAFQDGIDIHSRTASLIFGGPEDKKHHDSIYSTLGSGEHTQRDWGKKANHGLNYGMRENLAANLWEVPTADAKFVVDKYHAAYPGVKKFHAMVEEELRGGRTLTNLLGRKYRFWDRYDENLLLEAYSFIPQSTVADVMNTRGVRFIYDNPQIFGESRLIMTVHDSVSFQVPINIGWRRHAEMIFALRQSLSTPLIWRGHEFCLPSDTKMHTDNLYDGASISKAVGVNELEEELRFAYAELQT